MSDAPGMETKGDVAGRTLAVLWLSFLSLLMWFDQFVAGPIEAHNLVGAILFPMAAFGIAFRIHWAALLPPAHGVLSLLVLKPIPSNPAALVGQLVGMAIPTTLWILFFLRMRSVNLAREKAQAQPERA